MGNLVITPIRKVGPVQVNTVSMFADIGGGQTWPDVSQNQLSDERLYRLLISCTLTYSKQNIGVATTFTIDLEGPDQAGASNSVRLWQRFWAASSDTTTDPAHLQGTETMATVNRYQVNDFAELMTGLLLPPGFALNLFGASGGVNDSLEIQAMVATSPDPKELKPYVGSRTGGIAGPVY